MSLTVEVQGLDDLLAALTQLPKIVTQRNVVRRALAQVAEPVRNLASTLAPDDPTTPPVDLHTSIAESGSTSSRQVKGGGQLGAVWVYVGPTSIPGHHWHATEMEFGTFKDRPEPFMRPAWEAYKDRSLNDLGYYMWVEVDGALTRVAAKAARLAR